MIHLVRRFLPLLLGAWGGLFGSLTGWALHQIVSRSVDYLWHPWLGWQWLVGFLVYPLLGMVLAIPFVYVYPGKPESLQTDRSRVVDAQVRLWIAVFATLYLPIGFAFLNYHWWGAPTVPIPFTDVSLYPGSAGDLMATMIAVSILAPFCGIGVERVLRGLPAILRVLMAPPLATALALGGVLAAVLVSGGVTAMNMGATTVAEVEIFGPMLQPLGTAGWDTGSVLALVTVAAGCIGGALCTLTTTMPVLSGLVDLHPAASRRRWLLPLTAVAVTGVLAALSLLQGYGLDSFRPLHPVIVPGQPGVVGNLVAPSDHDTLRLEPDGAGLYLLEFPNPGPNSRHMVNISGYPLPSNSDESLRYLIDTDDYGTYFEISVQPVWPLRTGVSSYTGPIRFEKVERAREDGAGRVDSLRLDVEPGQMREWNLELQGKATELILDPGTAAYWTILAPRLEYNGAWSYSSGRSAVLVDVLARGKSLCKGTLDAETYSYLGQTMLVAAMDHVDPAGVRLILTPSAHPNAKIELAVVGEGLAPGAALVHPGGGASLLPAAAGETVTIHPEPGGTATSVDAVGLGTRTAGLLRVQDDGSLAPGAGPLLLMGGTRFRIDSPEGAEPGVVVVGADGAMQAGVAPWGWGGGLYR